jgi:hypothetical protein
MIQKKSDFEGLIYFFIRFLSIYSRNASNFFSESEYIGNAIGVFPLLEESRSPTADTLIKPPYPFFLKEVLEISVLRGNNKFFIFFYRNYRERNLFRILIIIGAYNI